MQLSLSYSNKVSSQYYTLIAIVEWQTPENIIAVYCYECVDE